MRWFGGGAAALATVMSVAVLSWLSALWVSLPAVSAESLQAKQTIRILDRDGNELYRVVDDEDRTFLEWEEIPLHVKQAVVAVEDERFYDRGCVDIRAITRAAFANITGRPIQGASTITQQLARTVYLDSERSIKRKIRELMLACELENDFTKDEILHLYLNWIPFGKSAYGVESASRRYFGKSVRDLSVAEAAILASLPQRPTYFSPYGSHLHTELLPSTMQQVRSGSLLPTQIGIADVRIGLLGNTVEVASGSTVALGGRADQVLANMQRLGFLTEEERLKAANDFSAVTFRQPSEDLLAPHFVLWVRDKLQSLQQREDTQGTWERSGLNVTTTLDPKLQRAAEETVQRLFPDVRQRYAADNVSLVAIDRKTREVLAYVGNADFFDDEREGKIDMALVPRQPGSSFKPFVYAAFFGKGYNPATIVRDTPLMIGSMRPKNYDDRFQGPLTVRRALASSRNIPAIRAFLMAGGEESVLGLASAAGIRSPLVRKEREEEKTGEPYEFGWPLALGSAEIPLVEMVHAYSALADGGRFKPMTTIRRISDASDETLYQPDNAPKERQAIDPLIAREITSILADEGSRPAGWWRDQLHLPGGLQAAVKTGTSNICLQRTRQGTCVKFGVNNVWAMGYTPDLVLGVWVGNADNRPLTPQADGLSAAAPLWKAFAVESHAIRGDRSTFASVQMTRK